MDAGAATLPVHAESDAGTAALPAIRIIEPDAGISVPPNVRSALDAGSPIRTIDKGDGIPWPEAIHPMAVLDGPAIIAAHAALQHVLARYPKEYAQRCAFSAKAMEVMVAQHAGLYFVQINQRMDHCGWADPYPLSLDWFELYAVSPDGQILARYPYYP